MPQTCPESVSTARGGVFGTSGYDEVLVSTYTGLVFGLTTERVDGVAALDSKSVSLSQDTRRKLATLRAELDALEEKVAVEREKYLSAAESGANALSVVPYLNINHKAGGRCTEVGPCMQGRRKYVLLGGAKCQKGPEFYQKGQKRPQKGPAAIGQGKFLGGPSAPPAPHFRRP